MTKRFTVEPTARESEPYRVRDTKLNTIVGNYSNGLIARGYADQQNALLSPPWYLRLWHWLRGTKPQPTPAMIDEHTRRRQRIAERCELGQRRISQKG